MRLTKNYDNKLPFIIGITGHRDLLNLKSAHNREHDLKSIKEKIKAALKHWRSQFECDDIKESINTPIWILSGMADGADLLAIEGAEELWAEEGWPKESLKVIPCLPMSESAFRHDFSDSGIYTADSFSTILDKYRDNLIQLRNGLTSVDYEFAENDLNYGKYRNSLYLNLGAFIAKYSNVLIALWDEEHIDAVGGTGDVIRFKCGISPQWPSGTENKALSQVSDFDGQLGGIVHHIPVNRQKETIKATSDTLLTQLNKKQADSIFPTNDTDCKLYISHQLTHTSPEDHEQTNKNNSFLISEFITLIEQLNDYNNQKLALFDITTVTPVEKKMLAVEQLSLKDSFNTFKCADKTALVNQTLYRRKVLYFIFIALLGFSSYELISTFLDKPSGLILNIVILFAILLNILLRKSTKKSKLKWRYQLTRGVAESMRLRSFLNLADIPPTSSPLVPRRYRKRLPLLTHAIEVTEMNWWKYPIQPQLKDINTYWLQGQIDFLKSRLRLNEGAKHTDTQPSMLSKLLNSINPVQVANKLTTLLYKRPARIEKMLSKWTKRLFIMTCVSIVCLFVSQVDFYTGNKLLSLENIHSSMLMYPIQFTLLFTAIVALWNELSNYGPTANGYLNLLELYERARYSLAKELAQSQDENTQSNNGLHAINKQTLENLLIDLAKEAMQEHAEWNHYESISDLKNKH